MSTPQEPRELTPIQMFWGANQNAKDFSPHVQKVEPEEVKEAGPTEAELREIVEAEEALTPAPKDSLAQGSVPSEASAASIAPSELETPVQPATETPDADSESGKPSESNADEPPTTTPPPPAPATSSPASSSATSRGKSTPPVVAKPPTSA